MEISYVAVCTRCGSEFQPHVTTCIDCGAATEARLETPGTPWPVRPAPPASAPVPEAEAFSLPRDAEAAGVYSGQLESVLDLAVFLEDHGMRCRVDLQEKRKSVAIYAVCVAPADFERALALQRDHLAELVPDAELLPAQQVAGLCPACGTQVPEGALECPECELVVGGEPEGEEEEEGQAR